MQAPEEFETSQEAMSQVHRRRARGFGGLTTLSPAMQDVFTTLRQFAASDVSVLLLGETGVGKEVLARAIHRDSARARGPFVVLDGGAVPPSLAESELLGHERGAFTGAGGRHVGAFERANGGTLFLDEIGELRLDLQPRLLRGLESRKVRRVGGRHEVPVDLRIVAATNRDLRADVHAGVFREDLYFRIAVAVVHVPPLRDRVEDIPDLCRELLCDLGRASLEISEDALALLCAHPWPGNVRELKNALLCAAALLDPEADVLSVDHMRRVLWSRDALSWAP
jgi:DNA-binding NtrC family response regulator